MNPTGLNVVIDISHYNTINSFSDVRTSGIVGVIHKATQGVSSTDTQYATRRSQALSAGLWWGAYHFGTNDDGVAQAQHFLSVVNPGPQDLLALDFEQNASSQMTIEQAEQFVTEVFNQTGRYPGFYSDSLAGSMLGNEVNATLAKCWLWRAEYGSSSPSVPVTWNTWTMWQYTESGSVTGVSGNCDRDTFNGGLDSLTRLWGYAAAA